MAFDIDWLMLAAIAWAVAWCVAQFSPYRAYRMSYHAYLEALTGEEPIPPTPPNRWRGGE